MSSRLPIARRWVVKGEDDVDGVHLSFAAAGTEAGINAELGQVGIHVGYIGPFRVG